MSDFSLPTAEGETAIFWTEDREFEPSRGVLTSNGEGAWTMSFEVGRIDLGDDDFPDPDDGLAWKPGGTFRPCDLRDFNLDLAQTFARAYDLSHADILGIMVKGRCEFPLVKPVTLARLTGSERWRVKLLALASDSAGHPMMTIEQSRPLTATEWFVVCLRLAKATDWWDQRMGDDA